MPSLDSRSENAASLSVATDMARSIIDWLKFLAMGIRVSAQGC